MRDRDEGSQDCNHGDSEHQNEPDLPADESEQPADPPDNQGGGVKPLGIEPPRPWK